MANGWGGARKGSGRKSNAEKFRMVREAMEADLERIYIENIPVALKNLVEGCWREETDRDGTVRIYQQPPNITAIQEVLNRIAGKPVTAIELSGPDGNPIETLIGIIQRAEELPEPEPVDVIETSRNGNSSKH